MLVESITQLKRRPEQAIIINVGTKGVSTLALLSALRYAAMPVLLIDCESDDGSFQHFIGLQSQLDFDLLAAPLRRHSSALDWIFNEIPSEKVLLIDSDIEILNGEIFEFMRRFIDSDKVFGCGFIEGPNWMSGQQGFMRHGLFEERMWIPLTMLKVSMIRAALGKGESFAERQVFNDFSPSPFISRVMGSIRYRIPALQSRQLRAFDAFKESHHGLKPWLVWYDTGAQLYRHLKYIEGHQFVGLPAELHDRYAIHFSGVTNNRLNPGRALGAPIEETNAYVRARLRDEYRIDL